MRIHDFINALKDEGIDNDLLYRATIKAEIMTARQRAYKLLDTAENVQEGFHAEMRSMLRDLDRVKSKPKFPV